MATPRETLKYYFRKYALPTEEQFGELIDAFVHKDEDMLTQEKIDGLTAALESKLSSEDFATAQAALNSAIEALQQADTTTAERLSAIEDDVATNADNIAGTILRVSSLESTVQEIVDGGGSGGGSDTNLYVKQIADLDTYEGTTGEIVQYIGQTTSTRTRGFFYEKKAGEEKEVTIFYEGKDCYTDVSKYLGIENYNRLYQDYGMSDYGFCTLVEGKTLSAYSAEGDIGAFVFKDYHAIGDFYTDTYAYRITDSNLTEDDSTITIGRLTFDKSHEIQMPIWRTSEGKYIASTPRQGDSVQYWVGLTDDFKPYCFGAMDYAQDPTTDTITTDPSWQVIPVGPCVN